MPNLTLTIPISQLFGVGDTYAKRLQKLNITTARDLLYHKPSRYEDWSLITPTTTLQAGEKVTIIGKLTSLQPVITKQGKHLQLAIITDDTGSLPIIWFNQRYLLTTLQVGSYYSLAGLADNFNNRLHLINPEFELLKTNRNPLRNFETLKRRNVETIHTGRLVPIYPETYGVSSKWLRAKIAYLLQELLPIHDWMPDKLRLQLNNNTTFTGIIPGTPGMIPPNPNKLLPISESLYQLHFPDTLEQAAIAQHRLAHDELLLLHLETLTRRHLWNQQRTSHETSKRRNVKTSILDPFIRSLPFTLTSAQQRSINEILANLNQPTPMNRLLEGDVGSGKTVIAAAAAFATAQAGYQTALMAPTEILAQQHYQTISKLMEHHHITVALQTNRTKHFTTLKRRNAETMKPDIVVGTHALLTTIVDLPNLALVVIDEQHRFGVEQRTQLIHKGTSPHVLNMTATPIPRTIALTLYGDLDLSLLDEMPPGRKSIQTWLVPNHKREPAYDWIKKQLWDSKGTHPTAVETLESNVSTSGQTHRSAPTTTPRNAETLKRETHSQVFIVCPFIEPSETLTSVKAATDEFHRLQHIFKNFKLDLLHGKLKGHEKDTVIEKFRSGHTDILVTTPVVEVGVDIPNASIMLIEAAERFGLAQLHQLRGRVGRAGQQAYCLLFTESDSDKTQKRLKALENSNSGLELAELDLKLRGPGQIFGHLQHGFIDLRFASYTDQNLIKQTKHLAQQLFPELHKYPELKNQLEQRTIRPIEPN